MKRAGNVGSWWISRLRTAPQTEPAVPAPTPTGESFCSKCLRRWPMRVPHDGCIGKPEDMDAVVVSKPIAANIGLRYQR